MKFSQQGFTPHHFSYHSKNGAGFTLIELLLYVSVASIMLFAVSIFLSVFLEARVKNQAIIEVHEQGAQIMTSMTQAVRSATSITSPAIGTSGTTLHLVVPGANPTVFTLSGSALQVAESGGAAVLITSDRVSLSSLSFQNLARPGTSGSVRIQFTLQASTTAGRSEFSYSKIFRATANVR